MLDIPPLNVPKLPTCQYKCGSTPRPRHDHILHIEAIFYFAGFFHRRQTVSATSELLNRCTKSSPE
uniref:Uncharacterized protein n=1 Tax=Medicago truncatula TaxID=3880 RepID=Q1RUA7_MEDTR|nr:hypothetical protein MtrDRAFT_AC153123g37v2 [Medicago truncatula]